MTGIISAASIGIAFVVTALLGFLFIPFLRKLKFGQTILDIGPTWHKSKQGTPTMGGLMFIIGTIVAVIAVISGMFMMGKDETKIFGEVLTDANYLRLVGGIVMALGFSLIGFIDDYIKVVKKQNLGLTALQKTVMQLLVAATYLLALALQNSDNTGIYIPFVGNVDFGIFFWPIALIVIYGFVNAANLTDGVDGLAPSVTMVMAVAFMLCAGLLHLNGMVIAGGALAGACLGFLVWNFYPAKVFMGDTGSMFLGGMVCALAFGLNRPILLLPVGIIYIAEALSVVIQVAYYKRTKKRIFKMSPIHHHFELSGWSEIKIVAVFTVIAILGAGLALLAVAFEW